MNFEMRYIVDVFKQLPESASFNAWQKAPADVIRTLLNAGAEYKFIIVPNTKYKFFSLLIGIINTIKIALSLKNGDELYIQRYGNYISLLTFFARKKKIMLNYIVHDLTFLRFGHSASKSSELSLLKKMDVIFVHTEAMAEIIMKVGIKASIKIMHLFDYYSDDAMIEKNELLKMKNIVAFAGNLDKSLFLHSLAQTKLSSNIEYRLYGLLKDKSKLENEQIHYMGAFKPNETGLVKAGWGLLWDGDSIETCSSMLGQYLKINSSHKLSLYIACGMPVIVWKESSLAKWLSEKGVCVLINSLNDIPAILTEITDEHYSKMVDNARMLGKSLRHGELLKSLLEN